MLTFEEMDTQVSFRQQLSTAADDGRIVLVNRITVPAGQLDRAIEAWSEDAAFLQGQPGFVSTQLHQGVAGSSTLVNVAVWESAGALRRAFTSPEFQGRLHRYPDGTVTSPHAFTAVSVPGIC
jgi:heme-degrading monooxygenase HmoA